MPTEDQIMEKAVEALLAKCERGLMAAARRVSETIYDSYDERRDAMIDRVAVTTPLRASNPPRR